MTSARILILTAVFPEARAIARAFYLAQTPSPLPLWTRDEFALASVGIRAPRLPELAAIPELAATQVVIMAGVAGALSPALKLGDVVVDARDIRENLPPLKAAFLGRLHTAAALIATPDQKSRLFASTARLAVDMETDPAAAFAAQRSAAFLALRGISDTAAHALDPALLTLVDAHGRPRIGKALAMLSRNPAKLPAMLRLARGTNMAMTAVAATLLELTASGWHTREADRRTKS